MAIDWKVFHEIKKTTGMTRILADGRGQIESAGVATFRDSSSMRDENGRLDEGRLLIILAPLPQGYKRVHVRVLENSKGRFEFVTVDEEVGLMEQPNG